MIAPTERSIPAEFAQTLNPRRDAVLRSRNGSAPQPAPTFVVEIGANPGSNEELVGSALAILDRAPDVDPDPGDD
ncbi:hypothetical protein HF263_23020 [Rhizobium leguminosarum]|nr:hypothetical protein [Rhizobium leguminosarum]MBY3058927.1 hypothetical protein [Rhizobium leguminosarum]